MGRIIAWVESEPAVILGGVGSVTLTLWQVSQGTLSVDAAIPMVFGVITRFFVSPAE